MRRALTLAASALFCLTFVAAVNAQDHLECYSLKKDPQTKVKYTADLTGLAVEPGCVVQVPAKMVCVPTHKRNVTPTPPGTGGSDPTGGFACYKVTCPKRTLPSVPLDDQFGTRTVVPAARKFLCAPLGSPVFTCAHNQYPQCGGTCPTGQTCQASDVKGPGVCSAQCNCVDPATACGGSPCAGHICDVTFAPFQYSCETCGNDGATCDVNADCCCQSCSSHPVGATGFCQGNYGDPGCLAPCQ